MNQQIVVVDDEPVNLTILGAILGLLPESQVHTFGSSRDALASVETMAVDAFVLDYHMPEPDGLTMIRTLRADPRFEYVPIIIVTGEQDIESRVAALSSGANDYIERPIEPRELLARIGTLLALHSERQRLSEDIRSLSDYASVHERHARQQAERMVSLWRIVTNTTMADEDVPHAIFYEGARALRPKQLFHGVLYRVDGDDVVVEAKTRWRSSRYALSLGDRVPAAETIASLFGHTSATRAWDDVRADPPAKAVARVAARRARGLIGTSFYAARSQYVLEFWSTEPMTNEPFTAEDFTYIELLAAFFASRLEQEWQRDRISYQLSHDSLTGLRNRTQFRLDAREMFEATGAGAVAVVSLDGFHAINETYGYIIGDALLVEVGAALAQRASAGDVVARLPGDNFALFLPGIRREDVARARIAAFAETFEHGFSTGDREGKEFIPLSATIGISVGVKGDGTIDSLLAHATTATFVGRRSGRGQTIVYEPGMESEEVVRERRLRELDRALDHREFELYLQPHVDVMTLRVIGAEALIRWNHPERGLLEPNAFIPFAEANNAIRPISRWVMRATLQIARRLHDTDPDLRIFFNLAASDLTDMSIATAFREAAAEGALIDRIGVELTETSAIQDLGMTVQTVRALRDIGVSVALDDFGTGYSSLSLLRRIPVDIVKIDRSFIADVLNGERDAVIAETVIRVAEQFGFEPLAEGVETEAQLAWLRERHCRYAQGFAIAPPMPYDAFTGWLAQRRVSIA